jgi:gamma-glutamyl-gamma-aminobutyrate hydrolase PuuD
MSCQKHNLKLYTVDTITMVTIGIFSITLSRIGLTDIQSDMGISKAYVDWMKAQGVDKIVIIPHNTQPGPQLRRYLDGIDGLIIPGGNDDFHHHSDPYYQRIKFSLDYAKTFGLPVFGICAGMMAMVSYELETWPLHVRVYNVLSRPGTQKLTPKSRSALSTMEQDLLEGNDALAYNHHYGVEASEIGQSETMYVVAKAPQGYASMVEWNKRPWVATQWHPEKPEWEPSSFQNIPRSTTAIALGNFIGQRFVRWAKEYSEKHKKKRRLNSLLDKGAWNLIKTKRRQWKLFDMPTSIYVHVSESVKSM